MLCSVFAIKKKILFFCLLVFDISLGASVPSSEQPPLVAGTTTEIDRNRPVFTLHPRLLQGKKHPYLCVSHLNWNGGSRAIVLLVTVNLSFKRIEMICWRWRSIIIAIIMIGLKSLQFSWSSRHNGVVFSRSTSQIWTF